MLQNYYSDCYVLVHRRDTNYVNSFLSEFLDIPINAADSFEFPQYSDNPEIIFDHFTDLLKFLEENHNSEYYLFFKGFNYSKFTLRDEISQYDEFGNSANKIFEKHFFCKCFYTYSGDLILGISCPTQDTDKTIENFFFNELKKFTQSNIGYITYEQPPPTDINKFIEIASKWNDNNSYYENITD